MSFQYCNAGFPPMTDVSPNNITTGQDVIFGYDPLQTPCLEALPNFQGLTEYIEIDQDNHIEITISGLGSEPCLDIGVENPPYQYYSLGVLPEGEYSVQMYWTDTSTPLPVPPNLNRLTLGEVIQFGIFPPASVPTLGFWALVMIVLGVFPLVLYMFKVKMKKITVMLVLIFCSSSGFSKPFHIKSFNVNSQY